MPICCGPIRDAMYDDTKVRGIIHGIDDTERSDDECGRQHWYRLEALFVEKFIQWSRRVVHALLDHPDVIQV